MVFETFIGLVAFLAALYAATTRYLQSKLVDRSRMETIQAESRKLNEELKKAQQSKNERKTKEIMDKQLEMLPKMNEMMLAQMKPMLIILIVFGIFMWVVGQTDPSLKDDIKITLADNGTGCDSMGGDGIYSACYLLDNTNYGKWTANVRALEGKTEIGKNETYFLYNPSGSEDRFTEAGSGVKMEVKTDKETYYPGDTIHITAVPSRMTEPGTFLFIPVSPARETKIDRVEATLSNGTYFWVELPVAIPLLNVKTIYQPYWWFILISLLSSLTISFVTGQMKKVKKE